MYIVLQMTGLFYGFLSLMLEPVIMLQTEQFELIKAMTQILQKE